MAAVTMATMINNKVLMIIYSKFDHAELIHNNCFDRNIWDNTNK